MTKTAAVFGAIWGIFGLLFSLFLFLNVLAPAEAQGTGFEVFSASVRAYYDGASFASEAWFVAAGVFGFAALGLIGAGIVRQHHLIAGIFLLISCAGLLVVGFAPFLTGKDGIFNDFIVFLHNSSPETVLAALIILLITLLGFVGSLISLAFKPKASRPCCVQLQPVPRL